MKYIHGLCRSISLTACVLLGVSSLPAESQAATGAQDIVQVYRLTPKSEFLEGCFPPCDCPLRQAESIRGTFTLKPIAPHPLFDQYEIGNVNWLVTFGDGELRVTGSGLYRNGGEFARMHQLDLDLQVGDREIEHFSSGRNVGGSEFPDINIRISVHGEYCFDTVIQLRAEPVLLSEVARFELVDTSYLRGCYPPCKCPIWIRHPVSGRFGVIDLFPTTGEEKTTEFAVIDVGWMIPPPPLDDPDDGNRVMGYGIYRQRTDPEGAIQHRMIPHLTLGNRDPIWFDSDWVATEKDFQVGIDVAVARNKFYCFDEVFEIRSLRIPEPAPGFREGGSENDDVEEQEISLLGRGESIDLVTISFP